MTVTTTTVSVPARFSRVGVGKGCVSAIVSWVAATIHRDEK